MFVCLFVFWRKSIGYSVGAIFFFNSSPLTCCFVKPEVHLKKKLSRVLGLSEIDLFGCVSILVGKIGGSVHLFSTWIHFILGSAVDRWASGFFCWADHSQAVSLGKRPSIDRHRLYRQQCVREGMETPQKYFSKTRTKIHQN